MTISEDVITGTVTGAKTPEQWARVIRADLGQAVAGFVAAGQHLAEAKRAIPHGQWESWCKEQVGISSETAVRLMALPRHEVIANPAHGQDLPPSWRTLYEVSRLDPPLLLAAIEAGDIHAEMERKEAIAVVTEYRKAAAIEAAKSVQPGQWWQLGPHLLYCGDSASADFTGRAVGAALAFADPPYNAGKADWDREFTWNHDYLSGAAEIVAVTPGIGAIPQFMRATRMPYRWSMAAWISNGMTHGALGYGNWIYIALFAEAESIYREMQDHMTITVGAAPPTRHESRKPAALLVNLIESFTDPGDTVIDPFLGSGTTLFAADQAGRTCIGAEILPEYCAEIIARYDGEAHPL
jgi:hypothetical protein